MLDVYSRLFGTERKTTSTREQINAPYIRFHDYILR